MANNNRGRVPEQERCRGTSRQSKQRCKRRRSPGAAYCIFHGGRAPRGGTHPNFKDGRCSKYMPSPELLQHYLRRLDDPELTHHRDSIALIDAMVEEAVEDLEDGGTPELWRSLKAAWRRVEKARSRGDAARLGEALDEAGLLIERGAKQTQRTMRVMNLLEKRRKHATAETKRRLAEGTFFTYEMAAAFYGAMGAAARKHFSHDQRALIAFLDEIMAIGGAAPMDIPVAPEAQRQPPE